MFGRDDNKLRLADLEKQLTASQSEVLHLQQRIEEQSTSIETLSFELEDCRKQMSEYKTTITDLKANHKTDIEKKEAEVNKKVNSALASIGVAQFANENFTTTPAQRDSELLSVYLSLPKAEQYAFYVKNKEKLQKLLLTR
jgi:TolA-binding protein